MTYVRLVLSFAAAMSGSACISIALLVYVQYRKPVVLYFAGFTLALLLFLCGLTVPIFELLDSGLSVSVSQTVTLVFMACGGVLYMLASPWFFHELFGDEVGIVRKTCYLTLVAIFVVGCVIALARLEWTAPRVLLNSLLFGMIGYGIVMVGVRLRQLGDRRLRRAAVIFFVLSAVFFPLMYLDSISPYLTAPEWLRRLDGTSLPLFFLILNSLSIVLATNYFNEPPYMESGVISDHFTGSFGLSAREVEIIEAVMGGNSNREIGEKLFISAKTVENHLYNIYQKTGVRNRVQLSNLIRGNKAG